MISSPKEPEAPSSAMLEAFHQFQHNPQVQVSGLVWNAELFRICTHHQKYGQRYNRANDFFIFMFYH